MKDDFPKMRHVAAAGGAMVIVTLLLNLAFWLGLIFGALWLLKHFGVIH